MKGEVWGEGLNMVKQSDEGILVNIKIVPNSSKNDIVPEDEFVKIKVTAQPVEGKANKALIEFLSKKFKIPKTSIEIVKGETNKEKTLLFRTNDVEKQNLIVSALAGK